MLCSIAGKPRHSCESRTRLLNPVQLVRTGQRANDQPGCVHANMDLFKWALRLWPLLPSEKVADALELAVSCRMLVRDASDATSRIGRVVRATLLGNATPLGVGVGNPNAVHLVSGVIGVAKNGMWGIGHRI